MKSLILDKNGNEYIKKSSNTAPNLDPNFWIIDRSKNKIKDILSRPYELYVWIYACVKTIANNISQIEHNISNKNNNEVIVSHVVSDRLSKPNKLMTKTTFLINITSLLLLPDKNKDSSSGGQCFIVPWNGLTDKPARLDKGEIPDEIMPFSESWFEPWKEKSSRGMEDIKGWTFKIPGIAESEIHFEHGEIIRIYLPNPYDILKGISAYSSVASSVELDVNGDIYNKNVFNNDGQLNGLVSSEQYIEKEELDKLKDDWYRQYTGMDRKRVAFLSGALKYQQLGLSPSELQNLEQGKWIRQKILGAYGLNRIAIGDYEDINFATIREGRKLLWYDTYIPLDKIIIDALNYQWVNFVDSGKVLLTSDYSKIPALQSDLKERVTTGGVLCQQMGFPPVLASRIIGVQLKKEDLEQWPFLNERLTQNSQPNNVPNQETLSLKDKQKSITERDKEYSNKYIKSILDPVEQKFRKSLESYFVNQRNDILDKIDKLVKEEKSINVFTDKGINVSGWEFLPDEAMETLKLLKMHKQAAKLQAALEKKQVENELHRGIEWDVVGTQIDYWTSVRAANLRKINTTTFINARDAINATVKQGSEEGITVNDMRDRIKQAVKDVYEVRLGKPIVPNGLFDLGGMSSSRTIARTEMGSIASLTRADIFKQEGIGEIEWITAHDEKVRDTHVVLDGTTVKYGEEFVPGLRYPRDPNGSAEEVINCRCSFVAVIKD